MESREHLLESGQRQIRLEGGEGRHMLAGSKKYVELLEAAIEAGTYVDAEESDIPRFGWSEDKDKKQRKEMKEKNKGKDVPDYYELDELRSFEGDLTGPEDNQV